MATSTWRQIGAVLELVEDAAITGIYQAMIRREERQLRVLDIGCGWGRYGALVKDCWPWATVTGIDARPERLRWRDGYDEILRAELPSLPPMGLFDIVLMLDVIEHLPDQMGEQALAAARLCGPVIVATPNGFMEQDGDKFDRHLSGWTPEALEALGARRMTIVPSRSRHPAADGPGQIVCLFDQDT